MRTPSIEHSLRLRTLNADHVAVQVNFTWSRLLSDPARRRVRAREIALDRSPTAKTFAVARDSPAVENTSWADEMSESARRLLFLNRVA
jgi:hypothetical protein